MESFAIEFGTYGAANASIKLLERFGKFLLGLRKRLKNLEDLPAKLVRLIELSKKITTVVENNKEEVGSYHPNVLDIIESGLVALFENVVSNPRSSVIRLRC